jgi:hypothetical protein
MMMPVARLACCEPTPQRTASGAQLRHHAGTGRPDSWPGTRRRICTWASWHWIFLINIPIGVAGCCMPANICRISPRHGALRYGRFFLFGLSLVLFSSGMELFGEKIVATWMRSPLLRYLLFLPIYVTRAATRRRLSRSLYLRPIRFPSGLRKPCHASGYRLRTVPDAADATGFGYPAMIAGCMMAPTRYGLDYCEINRDPGAALVWLS